MSSTSFEQNVNVYQSAKVQFAENIAFTDYEGDVILRTSITYEDTLKKLPKFTSDSFTCTNVPGFYGGEYMQRDNDEDEILNRIVKLSNDPGNGVLVVTGDGGVGKTTLVSRLFGKYSDAIARDGTRAQLKLDRGVVVLWLNCYQWGVECGDIDNEQKKQFSQALCQLANRASLNVFKENSISDIPVFFREICNQNVLFVFDDLYNDGVIDYFLGECDNHLISCVAITRNPKTFPKIKDITYHIAELPSAQIEGFLKRNIPNLGGENYKVLVDKCFGLPLIADLFSAHFKDVTDAELRAERLQSLLAVDTSDKMDVYEKRFKTVCNIFELSIKQLGQDGLEAFSVFLLFPPMHYLNQDDLFFIWKRMCALKLCNSSLGDMKRLSLVHCDDQSVFIHQYIHEAAAATKVKDMEVAPIKDKVKIVRKSWLLIQPSNLLVLLCESFRRHVLLPILFSLDNSTLIDVCLSKQVDKSSSNFLHFLYTWNWEDDLSYQEPNPNVKHGVRFSYRIIGRIFLQLKSAHILQNLFAERIFYPKRSILNELYDDRSVEINEMERSYLYSFINDNYFARYEIVGWQEIENIENENAFVDRFADPNVENAIGSLNDDDVLEAFLFCVGLQRQDIAKKILEKYPELVEESNIFWAACASGFFEVVKNVAEKRPELISIPSEDGTEPFFIACQNGHLNIAEFIYNKRPESIFIPNEYGTTPLIVASVTGYLPIVKFICQNHPESISVSNKKMKSPLWVASSNGHYDLVEYFFEKDPTSISVADEDGTTPLLIAASNGHLDIVQFIVNNQQQSVKVANSLGVTPFYIACENGHLNIVQFLYDSYSESIELPNNETTTPCLVASANGHLDVVKFIYEKCPNSIVKANCDGITPMYMACSNGHCEIVKFIHGKHSQEISKATRKQTTPFLAACSNGHLEIAKFIYDKDKESISIAQEDGETPLCMASYNGHFEVVKFIYDNNPESISTPNKNGATPFWVACRNNYVKIAKFIYDKDQSSILAIDVAQLMLLACNDGHSDIVRFLADTKPELLSWTNDKGTTLALIASANGHLNIVKFLHERCPESITSPNDDGITPVLIASCNGNFPIVNFISSQCPDALLSRTGEGMTPLWLASANGHFDIVNLIYQVKPEALSIANDEGITPYMVAKAKGHNDVAQFISFRMSHS